MRPRLPFVLALTMACVAPTTAHAFDTGHHADLTREAMLAEGHPSVQANVVLVMNWLTDYYSNSIGGRNSDLGLLHFDNLKNPGMTQNYWDTFTISSHEAVTNAARQRDGLKLLALLGISLHAVQDFYTHSNWVELRQPSLRNNPYSTKGWFDYPPGQRTLPGLRSGDYPNSDPLGPNDHGDYTSGMNHDSYCRPRWDESYVYAYAASRHWIRTFEQWAEAAQPGVWTQAMALLLDSGMRAALAREQLAAYRSSEWVALQGANGHWKGSGSGSVAEFGSFMASYMAGRDSRFAQFISVDKIDLELSKGLANPTAPSVPVPAVAPWKALEQLAVSVRTNLVSEAETGTWETRIDGALAGGDPDFYAMVTVDGLTFVEAMQADKQSIRPYWNTLRFVPKSQGASAVRYVLYDEDASVDDSCDVNPIQGVTDLKFTLDLRTGLIQGSNPPSSNLSSTGRRPDADRAQVMLTTRVVALEDAAPPADSLLPPTPISDLGAGETLQPGFASSGRVEGDGYWFEWRNLQVYRADLHVQFALDLRGGSTNPSGARAAFRLTLGDSDVSAPIYSGAGLADFHHFEGAIDAPPDPEDSRELDVFLVGTFPGVSRGQRDGDDEDVPDMSVQSLLGTLRW